MTVRWNPWNRNSAVGERGADQPDGATRSGQDDPTVRLVAVLDYGRSNVDHGARGAVLPPGHPGGVSGPGPGDHVDDRRQWQLGQSRGIPRLEDGLGGGTDVVRLAPHPFVFRARLPQRH